MVIEEKAASTLEYMKEGSRPPIWKVYLIWFGVSWVVCVLTLAVFIFGIPKLREIFKDFKTTLPALSQWILTISDFIAMQFGWILMLLIPFLLPLPVVVIEAVCNRKTARVLGRIYRLGLIALVLAMAAMIVLGLLLPLVKLMSAVSGGP
jgi:type II secretory pathway component PulF